LVVFGLVAVAGYAQWKRATYNHDEELHVEMMRRASLDEFTLWHDEEYELEQATHLARRELFKRDLVSDSDDGHAESHEDDVARSYIYSGETDGEIYDPHARHYLTRRQDVPAWYGQPFVIDADGPKIAAGGRPDVFPVVPAPTIANGQAVPVNNLFTIGLNDVPAIVVYVPLLA